MLRLLEFADMITFSSVVNINPLEMNKFLKSGNHGFADRGHCGTIMMPVARTEIIFRNAFKIIVNGGNA